MLFALRKGHERVLGTEEGFSSRNLEPYKCNMTFGNSKELAF
jgi:hypothetical protein